MRPLIQSHLNSGDFQLERLLLGRELLDSRMQYLVRNARGQLVMLVRISSEIDPQAIRRSEQTARDIAARLGETGARHIMTATAEHEVEGRSVAVYPYSRPMATGRISWVAQRRVVGPKLIRWLGQLGRQTSNALSDSEISERLLQPLSSVIEDQTDLDPRFQKASSDLVERLNSGKASGVAVASHGNIGRTHVRFGKPGTTSGTGSSGNRFMVVDWDAGDMRGYPFVDLVRAATSLRVRKRVASDALNSMCTHLDVKPGDVAGYVAASLGHMRQNLNYCPPHLLSLLARTLAGELARLGLLED